MSDIQAIPGPGLLIRRTFNAPRERVFDAWTDPQLLRTWFGPPGTTVSDVAFDARNGGSYRIVMTAADGEEFIVSGKIDICKRPEQLWFSFRWAEDDPKDEIDTWVYVNFFDRDGKTELVLQQDGFRDQASCDRHYEGWGGSLGQLDTLVSSCRSASSSNRRSRVRSQP